LALRIAPEMESRLSALWNGGNVYCPIIGTTRRDPSVIHSHRRNMCSGELSCLVIRMQGSIGD